MVVRKEFGFQAANGGHDIYACVWIDEDRAGHKGIVQLVHGMAEHILRYQNFAVFLAQQGFIVCGHDHAGHGRSVEKEEDFGFFGEQDNSWKYLIYDMHYMVQFIKKKFSNLPYFMIGHSMGSFLAREYAFEYKEDLSGAVFLGTSGKSAFIDAAILLMEKETEKKGTREKGEVIHKLALETFNLRCNPKKTDYDWICTDETVVQQFIEDEKCGFVFSFAGYRDLLQLLKTISTEEWAKGIDSKFPILLVSGTEDPVGEYGKGVESVYKMLTDAGCKDLTIKLYEGDRHEVLNETDHHKVYRFILKWLNEKLDKE